jgi:hypothetical protein
METNNQDTQEIMKKLGTPEVLFEVVNEQSNCPICLEQLDQTFTNQITTYSQITSPRGAV